MLATILIVMLIFLQTGVVLLDFNVGLGFVPAAASAHHHAAHAKIPNGKRR